MDWSYAVFLHMSCELNTEQDSNNWVWAPDDWKMNAGDSYVVREDGKPLCPRYSEALCAWCYQELLLKFQIAMEECYTVHVDRRKDALALITKKDFEAYREKFDKESKTADFDFDSTEHVYEELLRTGKIQGCMHRQPDEVSSMSRAAYFIR